jgi:drug/metabolite transporter (DMT)-like permease
MSSSPSPRRPSTLAIWAALVAVYLVWGSTYLAIRFVVEGLPPFLAAAARFLVAGAVLFTWRRLRGDPAPQLREWRSAAIIGAFLLIGGNGGVVWAEQRVPSGVAALLVSTVPLWMALIDLVFPKGRKTSAWVLLGVAVGLTGIVVLIGPEQFLGRVGEVDMLGAGVVTAASLSWAIGSLYSRQAGLPASPLLGTGMEMLSGGVGLLLLGTVAGEWGRLNVLAAPARSWAGLAYLIVLGTWVGFTSYTWLLRVAPTPLVSTYAYVNPLVAVSLGYLLGDEVLSPRILLATGLVVGAVALITVLRPRSPQI